MKIGLVCPYGLTYGGVQEHVRALYQNFTMKGHDVRIIAPRMGRENPKRDMIFIGRGIFASSEMGTGSHVTLGFHYGPIVEEILEKEKFDILHFHEPMTPTISWFLLAYSKCLNIMTSHHAQSLSHEEKSFYNFARPFIPLLTRKIHGRIAVSRAAQTFAQKHFSGKYSIIPNGVDILRFRPQGKKLPHYQDGKINILFVGRLEQRKGLIYLLRALTLLKKDNLRLTVVGDGPLLATYRKFAQKNGLDVSFEGEVSDKDLPLYYRGADIFCSPAIHGESFGIVLLEAMASGLPIIAYANVGYRELLSDYPDKKLLPQPKDLEGLGKSIKILSDDKNLRRKLGLWGRKKAKKYSWKKVTAEILKFYKKIEAENAGKKRNGVLNEVIETTPLPRFLKKLFSNEPFNLPI